MANDHVIVTLGMDTSPVAAQMRSVKSKVDLWAKDIQGKFSAAFRGKTLGGDKLDITDVSGEKARMASVEEASRGNAARRLRRIRIENKEREAAHASEKARIAIEDAKAENSFKKKLSFIKLAAKLGGVAALLNITAIADNVVDSIGSTWTRLGEISKDWIDLLGGGGLDSDKDEQSRINQLSEVARNANMKRWAEERTIEEQVHRERLQRIEEIANKANATLDSNSRRIEEREAKRKRDAMSLDAAIAQNQLDLITAQAAVAESQRPGSMSNTREGIATAKEKLLDVEDLSKSLALEKLNIEKQITREVIRQASAQQNKNDATKMTLKEIASSKNPALSGDRSKAAQAERLGQQAEAARLNGDSAGAEKLLQQQGTILNGRDPSTMTPLERQYKQGMENGERLKSASITDFYKNKLDAAGFTGIQSLKDSEKQTPFAQATKELETIRGDIQILRQSIENVTKE